MMNLFAQLTKVDEEKRLVYGEAASETVDKADEIMDYEKSKPHFKKWSDEVKADTGGKSLGNVRAMHGKVAAGKLTDIQFDDGNKRVLVCAKVVDDGEFKKVLEGVYTGFSIGGAYGDTQVEKFDGRDVKRYTAIPNEVSLVDRPCIPTAKFFEVQKVDGSLAKVEFKAPVDEDEGLIQGTPEQVDEFTKLLKTNGMSLGQAIEVLAKAQKDKGGPDNAGGGAQPKTDPSSAITREPAVAEQSSSAVKKTDADGDDDNGGKEVDAAGNPLTTPTGKPCDKAEDMEMAEKVVAARTHFKDDAATLQKSDAEVVSLHKAWVDNAPLRKMIDDAVSAQTAPLQKALDAANDKITKLEAQPAPTTVRLRAVPVSKTEDTAAGVVDKDAELAKAAAPIKDTAGEAHEAAGLIKAVHARGGVPLTMPIHELRK